MPNANSPIVNVVFGSDKGYIAHLAVALCSLFDNNPDLALNVYILNSDIDPPSWKKIQSIADRYDQKLIDLKVSEKDLEGLVTTWHFTLATYYRLFIPEKLSVDRVLYLDVDIVVNGSIRELYRTDLGDSFLAAVREPDFDRHEQLEMSKQANYFNAGVMVINLDKWREERLKESVIAMVKRKPEAMVFSDQCGINSVVNGRWTEVDPKFNLVHFYAREDLSNFKGMFPDNVLDDARRHPVIIHFSGASKPWHFHRKHPFRHLYWKYRRKTPFTRYFSEDLTIPRITKWFLAKIGVSAA
jgi:lipopolysaccharide biosynthesis glycosyltransferase